MPRAIKSATTKSAAKSAARPKRKSPPFPFLLEALAAAEPEVKQMFGGHAVYIGDKIVAMLRDSTKSPEDNGMWLVLSETVDPSSKSLRKQFPSIRKIALLDDFIKHWLLIPSDSPSFEEESLHACDLILARDPQIGRIPKSRR